MSGWEERGGIAEGCSTLTSPVAGEVALHRRCNAGEGLVLVVPANAGTHNHRCCLPRFNEKTGVWSPRSRGRRPAKPASVVWNRRCSVSTKRVGLDHAALCRPRRRLELGDMAIAAEGDGDVVRIGRPERAVGIGPAVQDVVGADAAQRHDLAMRRLGHQPDMKIVAAVVAFAMRGQRPLRANASSVASMADRARLNLMDVLSV